MAVWILLGLVTRRSSPTIWILVSEVSFFVSFPVILIKGILDRHNRIILDKSFVHLTKLIRRDPIRFLCIRVLEIQIILSILVEL